MAVIEANISKLTQERPPFKGHVVRSIWVEISRVGPEPLKWDAIDRQFQRPSRPVPEPMSFNCFRIFLVRTTDLPLLQGPAL